MRFKFLLLPIIVFSFIFLVSFHVRGQVFSDVSLLIFERISSKDISESYIEKNPCNLQIVKKKGANNLFVLSYTDKSAMVKVVITDYIFLRNPAIFLLDSDQDGKPDIMLEGIDSNGELTSKIYHNDGKMNLVEFLPPMDRYWTQDSKWKNLTQDPVLVTRNLDNYQLSSYYKNDQNPVIH